MGSDFKSSFKNCKCIASSLIWLVFLHLTAATKTALKVSVWDGWNFWRTFWENIVKLWPSCCLWMLLHAMLKAILIPSTQLKSRCRQKTRSTPTFFCWWPLIASNFPVKLSCCLHLSVCRSISFVRHSSILQSSIPHSSVPHSSIPHSPFRRKSWGDRIQPHYAVAHLNLANTPNSLIHHSFLKETNSGD